LVILSFLFCKKKNIRKEGGNEVSLYGSWKWESENKMKKDKYFINFEISIIVFLGTISLLLFI